MSAEVFYARNTVRVTYITYTWGGLQASADDIAAVVYKIQNNSLVKIMGPLSPGEDGFSEAEAGKYQLFLDTTPWTDGTYVAVFYGSIEGSKFFEPVVFQVETLEEKVRRGAL